MRKLETTGTGAQEFCAIHKSTRLPCVECSTDDVLIELADGRPAGMLALDQTEATRLLVGGRRTDLLREARTFDRSRIESSALFAPARPQQKLF